MVEVAGLPVLNLEEVAERLPLRPSGQRVRVDRLQGRDQLYRIWTGMAIHRLRRGRMTSPHDWFRTSWLTTAAALGYELSGDYKADMDKVSSTLHARADDLVAANLIEYRPATSAGGQIEALEVRILPLDGSQRSGLHLMSPCPEGGVRWRRRASHHLKPPRCVRGGRERPCEPRPVFFGSEEVGSPHRTDQALKGLGRVWDERARAHEGRRRAEPPAESNSRTGDGLGTAERRETRVAWRHRKRTGGRSLDGCVQAEQLSALLTPPTVGLTELAAGFALIFGRPARSALRRRAEQLERALRRCDRYAPDGPRPGAGAEALIDLMLAHNDAKRKPVSLAFFAGRLDWLSKQWRRASKRGAATTDPVRGDS